MKCEDCEGKGFKEYDAGLVQIYCKTCEGTGKVGEALTKEEIEKAYAFRSDMTVDQVRELGLEAVESDCVQGWAMQKIELPEPEPKQVPALKPGQYFCAKCKNVHADRETSKIGKRHLKYKVEAV